MTGKADKSHTHAASAITSGTLDVKRLPQLVALGNVTSSKFSIGAHGDATVTINVDDTANGWECVGMVGFNSNHNKSLLFYKAYRTNITTIECSVNNVTGNSYTDATITVCALYVKSNLY